MALRNTCLDALPKNYLFSEIAQRKVAFQQSNPSAHLINLGVGDTTEPLPLEVTGEIQALAGAFATRAGYRGYGEPEGEGALRADIANTLYPSMIEPDEVFISDGSKCDIGRLQFLFAKELRVGVQDPAYPVYADATILAGKAPPIFLPCTAENSFFPDLPDLDLLYLCSPNNPTGAVFTYPQLEKLVAWAHKHGALIIYDTAYAAFIQDPEIPKSIYAIPGARRVALETGSFSKMGGFTGLRLGWTVVPHGLTFSDGSSVHEAWSRIVATIFNGSSALIQAGGRALLTPEGLAGAQTCVTHYLGNAALLRKVLEEAGIPVYGGINAPYLWTHFPDRSSWEVFDELLEGAHLVTTPGAGFGKSGKGFVRLSAFGNRADIEEAAGRLASVLSCC